MSFSNDEEGDGLAALFGGITPQSGAKPEPGPRRSAAEPAPVPETPAPAAQAPASDPASPPTPQYPGLAPQTPPAFPAPGYATPGYPTPATPAYEMPAPPAAAPPVQPAPVQPIPQAYDLPAPAAPPGASSYAAPQYPGLAPASPAPYSAPQNPAPQNPAPQNAAPQNSAPPNAAPPAYAAPVAPGSAYPPTAQYPAGVDPAVAAAPEAPAWAPRAAEPPAYGAPAAGAPISSPLAYETPPTYQPPAYSAPASFEPPPVNEPSAYQAPPVNEPPAYRPPPVNEPPAYPLPPGYGAPAVDGPASAYDLPEPIVEPPAPSGFEALGLQPSSSDGYRGGAPEHPAGVSPSPAESPRAAPPVVRAEAAPVATVFPPGPLLPSRTDAVATPEELARSTVGEKIALPIAILTGPIGLIVAIVTAARGARRRGWLIGIARASLVLAVISTVAAGIGAYILWNIRADQVQRADITAASAEFCAAGAADPAIVTGPTLGWPAEGATITESLALMQAWTDNWTTLAATSPATLRTGMEQLAAQGQTIIQTVTASRVVSDASNQQQIAAIAPQSGVASWYATYCAEP